VRIGDLNTYLTIKRESTSTDSIGGQSSTWSTVATAWGHVRPTSGDEVLTADQLRAGLAHRITIRWRTDVNVSAKMRVYDGSRLFEVLAVENQDSDNTWLVLLCAEVLS
jgi:SPP1 family predicted phage head-tail adaptor